VILAPRLQELLDQDTDLADLCHSPEQLKDEEQAKDFLTHLKSKDYLVSRRDLTAIFGKNGEYLNQLLGETGYQPLEFSTGEELEEAIGSTSFLVDHWLPRGHVTAIVSSPGVGKTYVALEVVRLITTKQSTWFDGETPINAPNHVVIWCEAEGFQGGLRDRIQRLEIPRRQIIFPFKNPLDDFRLERHLGQLEDVIDYHEPDLVTIDSLRGSHGKEEKGSTGMQKIMSKLVSLAKNFNIAVLICHHTNKPAHGQPDLVTTNRVRGSGAIAANCRMIWGLERPDSEDETIRLKVVKSNLTSFPESLGLIITDRGVEWTEAPISDEEYAGEHRKKSKKEQAADWLQEFLKDGPKPSKEVESKGKEAGHSLATLRRASSRPNFVKFQSEDNGRRCWMRALADAQPSPSNKDEQVNICE